MKYQYISADSHFCENENFYLKHLSKKMQTEAPRYVDIEGNYFWTDSYSLVPLAASIGAGQTDTKLKFRCTKKQFHKFSNLKERIKMQEIDGALHEILLPNLGLLWRIKNNKIRKLCFDIYNENTLEIEKSNFKNNFTILPIIHGNSEVEMLNSLESILKKRLENNLHGLVFDMGQLWHLVKSINTKLTKKLLRSVEVKKIPIVLHANGTNLIRNFSRPYTAKHALFCINSMSLMVELYTSGFFDKFKNIKIIFSELGLSWINQLYFKLSYYKQRFRYLDNLEHIKKNFSEVLSQNIFCTFTTELPDIQTIELMGEKNLIFGSDFPHAESYFPNTNKFIAKLFKNYAGAQKFVIKNAIENYNLKLKLNYE